MRQSDLWPMVCCAPNISCELRDGPATTIRRMSELVTFCTFTFTVKCFAFAAPAIFFPRLPTKCSDHVRPEVQHRFLCHMLSSLVSPTLSPSIHAETKAHLSVTNERGFCSRRYVCPSVAGICHMENSASGADGFTWKNNASGRRLPNCLVLDGPTFWYGTISYHIIPY